MVARFRVFGILMLLLGGLVLSGCAGKGGGQSKTASSTSSSGANGEEVGFIAGTVTDEELVPLERVEVQLRGSPSVFTNSDGRYAIPNVSPGEYILDAAKIGFVSAARTVRIQAGETKHIEFQLVRFTAEKIPYHVVTQFTGNYDCALGTSPWVSACTWPYTAVYLTLQDLGLAPSVLPPDLMNNTFRYNFTVEKGAKSIVSEMVWQRSSPAAENMYVVLSCPNYDPVSDDCNDAPDYAAAEGPSPLRVIWPASSIAGFSNATEPVWVMARGYLPFTTVPQVALFQRFDLYNTIFYNGEPDPAWSAISG